jgi:hypothetical protein
MVEFQDQVCYRLGLESRVDHIILYSSTRALHQLKRVASYSRCKLC